MAHRMPGMAAATSNDLQVQWDFAQAVEKEIRTQLKKKDNPPSYDRIEALVAEFRKTSQNVIFRDFEFATKQGVENRIWDLAILLKNRFKKLLDRIAEDHKVEKRKLEKHYADFLKTTQFFYKGYIQRLASHFGGLKDLRRIAHCLALETLSADSAVATTPALALLIDTSCHRTLLHLGDLSRYRNELRTKKPSSSWEPALGYYALARDLCPHEGSAHNQMAVIALADQNHLDALYHLYRAIAIQQPHPLARGNLEIEFKKITSIWEKKEKQIVLHAKTDCEAALILWFVRLHAKFYKGTDFASHDELENEVLSRLALLLKEQSFEQTLERIVIINIAAEFLAGERVKEEGTQAASETIQSFFFFLRFNLRVLFVLLQILQPELEDSPEGEDLPNESRKSKSRERITAVARRILPALRQYSTWLVSQAPIITATVGDGPMHLHIKQMWSMYADVMSKIVHAFPVDKLPTVEYLLEEDEITVGFKPLREPSNSSSVPNVYVDAKRELKARMTDPGIERNHPNIEMLARVRDILLSALSFHLIDGSAIKLNSSNSEFVYIEERLQFPSPSQVSATMQPLEPHNSSGSPVDTSPAPVLMSPPEPFQRPYNSVSMAPPSVSHVSMDTDMNRMVDDLLDTSSGRQYTIDETSYGMHSGTANDIFFANTSRFQGLRNSPQRSAPLMTSGSGVHPGIWSSAFTPQPNELPPISPERPSTARQLSPLTYESAEDREQARLGAATLEAFQKYKEGKSAWDRKMQPFVPPTVLPEPELRYTPICLPSSNFSDDSSIYGNPPASDVRMRTGLGRGHFGGINGHDSTFYPGATDFDKYAMLQSSLYDGSQPAMLRNQYVQTPPGGQGG